jgi:nucleoside phosphorylase
MKEHFRKYWFGINNVEDIASIVLVMERNRIEQFKAALDMTRLQFKGVFEGITGSYKGRDFTLIHSISPAHIADCVTFLSEGFEVTQFISAGSVGGLRTSMGDIVVSNSCSTQDGYSLSLYSQYCRTIPGLGQVVDISMSQKIEISNEIHNSIHDTFNCSILHGKVFTIPAVSLESKDTLDQIQKLGFVALDLETGPFLSACKKNGVNGICIHWVTDLPLERDFYYKYYGDPTIVGNDQKKKHRQWLNYPKIILPIAHNISNR